MGLGGAARLPRMPWRALLAAAGARAGAKAGVEAAEDDAESGATVTAAAAAGRASRSEDFAAAPPPAPVPIGRAPVADATVGLDQPAPRSELEPAEPRVLSPVPPRGLPAGPSPWGRRSEAEADPEPPEAEPPDRILDAHLVVDRDGREIYQVYQRAEPARS